MAQCKSKDCTPKADLTAAMAEVLEVSSRTIAVPDTDMLDELMHTLFALKDSKLLRIQSIDDAICLRAEIADSGFVPGRSSLPSCAPWKLRGRSTTAGGTRIQRMTIHVSTPPSRRRSLCAPGAAGSPR